jgi:hypothetical protein
MHINRKINLYFTLYLLFLGIAPSFSQENRILGDVNGDGFANTTDAMLIAQLDGGFRDQNDPVFVDFWAGDVNFDNQVNTLDALLIAQYDAKLIDNFANTPTPIYTPTKTGSF